jgi:ribonuclease-3 family protein
MDFKKLAEYNLLSLAYLGDAVWDMAVREYFFGQNLRVDEYNREVKKYVNAKYQSLLYEKIYDALDDEYKVISKRGRNTKIKSFAKTCSPREYRNATAFEVLLAVYHLRGEKGKVEDLLKYIIEGELINEKK